MSGGNAPALERDVAIGDLALDCGRVLPDVVQRISIYGTPRPDGANVVLVEHALTGSSRTAEWWPGIVGPGCLLDTDRLAVVGVNILGSCYGSTGPTSLDPSGRPYGAEFPVIGVGDMVRAQQLALAQLEITQFAAVAGGSLGGMQALEWALRFPTACDHAIVVGAYDYLSALGIALNAVAREAIRNGGPTPQAGIELARKIAMLTYKSDALLAERFGRNADRRGGDPYANHDDRFDVEGYLDYQGRIFSTRMDDASYLTITRAMDLFDTLDRPLPAQLPALTFVGISSDWLFLPQYVRAAADRFAAAGSDSIYLEMRSDHGHDAFLAETAALADLIAPRIAPLYERLREPVAARRSYA
ncbi:MAG: homoserine O-acetyltransferase family protein [Vulcanimicrobiaceae bacterium]